MVVCSPVPGDSHWACRSWVMGCALLFVGTRAVFPCPSHPAPAPLGLGGAHPGSAQGFHTLGSPLVSNPNKTRPPVTQR